MPGIAVAVVAVLKPFVLIWAGLNALDDLTLLVRLSRLTLSVVPFPPGRQPNPKQMCGVCDAVIEELLVDFADNLGAIPCEATCFGLKRCVDVCRKLQEASAESNEFPCIAAGFCDPVEEDTTNIAIPQCKTSAFFSCTPSAYCQKRRKRKGLKVTCELKPGIGHWVGLKKALASDHVGALASGLVVRSHCGDPGAGPYCIATPKGVGLVAEFIGHFIALVFGTYKSIIAIESRGGSDDRQWLTFWVILSILLSIERYFARVILSSFPYYYQVKLLILIWLVWRNGADHCYRKLRRILESNKLLFSEEQEAARELKCMQLLGKFVVQRRVTWLAMRIKSKWKNNDWDYDGEGGNIKTASQQLYELSMFILSTEGLSRIEECKEISNQNKMLLVERAASVVSFQPRFLRVHVVGTVDGPRGALPSTDADGLADPFIMCRLVSESGKPYPTHGVSTKVVHNTLAPRWDQELEIPLRGGIIDSDGFFRCEDDIETMQLELVVRDADLGIWKYTYYLFRILAIVPVLGTAVAHIEGLAHMQLAVLGAEALFSACFIVSYVMAVSRRSHYENIGQCMVPIGMLMDQRDHALLLNLHEPEDKNKWARREDSAARTNSTGGFGTLRVRLMLSER